MVLIEAGGDLLRSDNENQTPKQTAVQQTQHDIVAYARVIEEEQRLERSMEELKVAYLQSQEACKQHKSEVVKASKEAKKKVASAEKASKRARKETLKLKKKRTKGSAPEAGAAADTGRGPQAFSQIAMPTDGSPKLGSARRASLLSQAKKSSLSQPAVQNVPVGLAVRLVSGSALSSTFAGQTL